MCRPRRRRPTGPSRRRACIGIVDDNEDAAVTLALPLDTWGHEVEVPHSAQAALARLPAFQPDVCLLDIGLPEMNGFDLARCA